MWMLFFWLVAFLIAGVTRQPALLWLAGISAVGWLGWWIYFSDEETTPGRTTLRVLSIGGMILFTFLAVRTGYGDEPPEPCLHWETYDGRVLSGPMSDQGCDYVALYEDDSLTTEIWREDLPQHAPTVYAIGDLAVLRGGFGAVAVDPDGVAWRVRCPTVYGSSGGPVRYSDSQAEVVPEGLRVRCGSDPQDVVIPRHCFEIVGQPCERLEVVRAVPLPAS